MGVELGNMCFNDVEVVVQGKGVIKEKNALIDLTMCEPWGLGVLVT